MKNVNKKLLLAKAAGRAAIPVPSLAERGMLMSTYEEMQILLTFAMLVVAILNLKNK